MLPNLGLPSLTGSYARDAQTIGDFGLVYQLLPTSDLGLDLPSGTFTNHYRRTEGLGIMYCYNGLGTVIDCGEHPTGLPIQLVLDAVGFGLGICFE